VIRKRTLIVEMMCDIFHPTTGGKREPDWHSPSFRVFSILDVVAISKLSMPKTSCTVAPLNSKNGDTGDFLEVWRCKNSGFDLHGGDD